MSLLYRKLIIFWVLFYIKSDVVSGSLSEGQLLSEGSDVLINEADGVRNDLSVSISTLIGFPFTWQLWHRRSPWRLPRTQSICRVFSPQAIGVSGWCYRGRLQLERSGHSKRRGHSRRWRVGFQQHSKQQSEGVCSSCRLRLSCLQRIFGGRGSLRPLG